jgi:hypothetical protein
MVAIASMRQPRRRMPPNRSGPPPGVAYAGNEARHDEHRDDPANRIVTGDSQSTGQHPALALTTLAVCSAANVVPKWKNNWRLRNLLGPQIAGRLLGARPLWAEAQRVNRVGAGSPHKRCPELPWTFGVIDAAEINAFAAPGGYILVTRGLYELLISDEELAAVLGHEISRTTRSLQCDPQTGTRIGRQDVVLQDIFGSTATNAAAASVKRYVDEYGATIMLTALGRDANITPTKRPNTIWRAPVESDCAIRSAAKMAASAANRQPGAAIAFTSAAGCAWIGSCAQLRAEMYDAGLIRSFADAWPRYHGRGSMRCQSACRQFQ